MDSDMVVNEIDAGRQDALTLTASPKPALWGFWPTVGLSAIIAATTLIVQVIITFSVLIVAKIQSPGINIKHFIHSLPSNGLFLSVSMLVSAPVVIGLTLLFIRFRKGAAIREYLGLHNFRWKGLLKWEAVLLLFLLVEALITNYLNRPVSEFMINAYKTAYSTPLFWFVIVVSTPIYEEIFFRGFLFTGFRNSRLGPVGAITITSFLWALVHTQYDIYGMSIIFAVGLLLGYARLRSDSIYASVAMHSLMNLIGAIGIAEYLHNAS